MPAKSSGPGQNARESSMVLKCRTCKTRSAGEGGVIGGKRCPSYLHYAHDCGELILVAISRVDGLARQAQNKYVLLVKSPRRV